MPIDEAWTSPQPDKADNDLTRVRDHGYSDMPQGEARSLVGDSLQLFEAGQKRYLDEITELDATQDHLEAGAGDRRRLAAKKQLADDMATANRIGQAGIALNEEALVDAALPKREEAAASYLPNDRTRQLTAERLDRDEFVLLVGDLRGGALGAKLNQLVTGGTRDEIAALAFTDWGRSFIASRGGLKPELTETLRLAAAMHRNGDAIKKGRKNAVGAVIAARGLVNMRTSKATAEYDRRRAARDRRFRGDAA